MSISQQLAAQKQQAEKPGASAADPQATAKSGKAAEAEEDDEEAEAGDEEEDTAKKAKAKKAAKAKTAKKAEAEDDEDAAEGEDDDEKVAADPGTVAQLCVEAGVPQMAKALIDARLPLKDAKAKIDSAGAIRAAVATAGRVCRTIDPKIAEGFISKGASVEHAKAELFDMIVKAEGPEIRTSQTGGAGGQAAQVGSYGWDKTVEKLNARHGGPAANA